MSERRRIATLHLPWSATEVSNILEAFDRVWPGAVVRYDGDPQNPEIWTADKVAQASGEEA